jgi:hypothetical protein
MTEGFNAADRSSIAPVILPIALDNCQNSAAGEAVARNLASGEGFFRLTVEDFCENAIEIIKQVMQKGDRIILQQAGKDLGAIVPEAEFHKLNYLMKRLKPSQFFPDEEAYYQAERAIYCIYPDELGEDLDNILADVKEFDELFGLLPTEEMGENIDIFMPVAILISIDRFWMPEYLIAEQARLKTL